MRTLSIRQPYAELIPLASSGQALRVIKTVELPDAPVCSTRHSALVFAACNTNRWIAAGALIE
jgi:hypothetical protein